MVRSITQDSRYRVASELSICPAIGRSSECACDVSTPGWYIQQLIKLSIARHISAEYYVILDSDIICMKAVSYASLIHNGRALTNVETPRDYHRLYNAEAAMQETSCKQGRYRRSAALLGYTRPSRLHNRFYGETPVALHTKSVLALTAHIERRFLQPWDRFLLSRSDWTEYSLYFQYLEMFELLYSVTKLKDCNEVLDLERSVWLGTAKYRDYRLYNRRHFTKRRWNGGGYFMAVQSWLRPSLWLPPSYTTTAEFYRDVERWLLPLNSRYPEMLASDASSCRARSE